MADVELKHKGIIVRIWPRRLSKFQTYDVYCRQTNRIVAVGSFNTDIETIGDVLEAIKERHATYGLGFKLGDVVNKGNYATA